VCSFGSSKTKDYSLGDDPTDATELELNPCLLDSRILLLEVVGEPETDNGQSGNVILGIALVDLSLLVLGGSDQAFESAGGVRNDGENASTLGRLVRVVDLRQAGVIARVLKRPRDEPSLRQVVLHNAAVPGESEVQD
jgi:hypothetical protein